MEGPSLVTSVWPPYAIIYKFGFGSNPAVETSLIHMYSLYGNIHDTRRVFDTSSKTDPIAWNIMITTYNKSKLFNESRNLFNKMKKKQVKPTLVTLVSILLAREFFDRMPEKDLISWTAMIDGYVKQNRFKESLILFKNMQDSKVEPDEFTMVSVLTACANTGALELGEWIKVCIDKKRNLKIKNDVFVGNALIDMYFKCTEVGKAVDIFKKMVTRDKFTWTNMIVGYGINGFGNEALKMFNEMMNESIKPDGICYLSVLCACVHSGMVNEGRKLFDDMRIVHGIEPEVEHYASMVDLLGRAGLLSEAFEFINLMPVRPNSVVWRAFLGACVICKNVDLGEIAGRKLVELEPDDCAVYLMLCNMYAGCSRWEELREVRNLMMKRGITKTPGCSCIEIYGSVHEFVVCDRAHFQCDEIYSTLDIMTEDLKVSGFKPNEMFLDYR